LRAHSPEAGVASVKRAIASGDLGADTNPEDFDRALVGIVRTTAPPGWEQSARRLVDILIAGSRSTPKHANAGSVAQTHSRHMKSSARRV